MASLSSDKIAIGAATLVLLASAAAFGFLGYRHAQAPKGPPPTVSLSEAPYVPIAPDAPPVKIEPWQPPAAQTRGREWIYDVFTPPEIFYNARTKQFTVKPPSSLVDEEMNDVFGLELVAVRPEPFRLQLIGFAGDEAKRVGVFQDAKTGQVYTASTGFRVPKAGLVIRKFEVLSQPIRLGEGTTTRQRVATAVVHDEQSGRDTIITHRERVFTGTLSAFVAEPGETATREVRQGDTFKIGDASYRIESISLTPPVIEVTKEAPSLPEPLRQPLRPREIEAPEAPDAKGGGGAL